MEKKRITQCRKPHGEDGLETIKNMNKNHERISEYAFECIELDDNINILDIGCGGGVNIEKFLNKCPNSIVDGLDYSELSVQESIKRNQRAVDENKSTIIQANVANMPIDDKQYDVVSAFETVYFWPDLSETFKEVYRIIKENGQFMIASETDGHHPDDEKWLNTVEGMSVYTKEQLEEYLLNAGFKEVNAFLKEGTHILVVIARK